MRTKTLIVTAVTAMLALGLTTALNAADWVRDANGHVLIQSKADLETLRDWVAAGENTVGMTFLQTADIDLCDVVWAGIGARDQKDNLNEQGFLANPFRGVYDGHGHTILNVKLKAGDYDGFFNSVDRATIRNLKMSIRENGIDTTTSGSAFVTNHTMAVFVGVAKESTLANLETIRGETVATREFRSRKDASGIVGLMVDGVVEGCTNNLDVTFGTVDNRKGAGIVLLTQSGSDAVKIKSCLNAGRVRCNTCAQAGAGGILGFVGQETLIECCENRGSVETVVEQGAHVGTIVGFCDKAFIERITSKANKAQDSILSAGLPLVGLNFATVENSVASFVADDALTIGSVYRVMTSVLTNAFHFSSSGSIAFDCELNRNFRLDVTAESGLVLSSSEVNGVRTYRAEPTITVGVSNVVTRQRYPWNGLVDIDCEIACSSAQGNVNLWIEAKNKATGQTLPVRHIWLENDVTCTNALAVKAGRHRLVWDAGADAPNVVSSDVTITVRVQVPAGQAGSGSVRGDQATGTPMRLDTRTGVRIVSEDAKETLVYSPRWGGAANCAVTADGVVIKTASSEGEVTWSPTSVGMHTLTFAAGNVAYTAQFRVKGALFPMADGGTGTQESPYLISSVDGLENLRLAVEDGMAGTAHFKLINDLDMSAYGPWPGIGQYDPNDTTGENAFRGVFDGGGHTIRGLYFTRRTYGGLFNQVWGGTVRNLSIEFGGQSGFAFAANDTNVSTNEACGAAAFVGHAAGNACLEGLTSLGRIEGTHNVAGIVIRLGGAEGCTVVRGCTNRAEIVGHYTKASGISVLTIDDGSTVLERCCNEGIVHATAGTTVTGSLIGCDGVSAMLAYCSQPTTIRDCENRGNVFADEPTALVGELVGLSRLEIAGSGNIIVKGKRSLGSSGGFSDLYVGRVVNGNVVCGVPLSNNQSYEVLASFPSNFVYRLENDGDWISFDTTVADFNGQIAKSSPQQIILERRDGSVRLFTVQTLESGDGNVVHAGQLTTNETWTSESVHLVTDEIKVPSGRTLTIEPGAVVKFATGTSLIVNGSCLAHGVVFTHLFDDTVGGDTLKDGDATTPVMGAYTLSGNINEDDATEERYSAPQTLTSSISGTVRLKGHKVYLAKSSVTVNSGATLTFLPGAIVKFASGCSLTVRGTLDALGTRAEPIIFTSINDDSYGGKTEVSTHNPQPGDWSKIGINGGRANFSHAYVLYSSRNSTTGAINMNGGMVVFTDGIISHGKYDAVGVESGRFFMTNSVISDCLLAFRHWARDPIVNCVIYDCGRLTQGGGQTFVNCIFSRISETWEAFGFPQNGTTYRNCCFWNETGSVLTAEGKQDAMTVCGKNGNVWGNPLFLSPDAGDFRIKSGSPCVDAADGTMAPETDTWGQPRKTVLAKEFVTGTPSARGECADIGIYEVIPDDVKGDVDLVPVAISGADAATPGETLLVEWQVANNGEKHMSGSWRDTIMLVSENGQQVVLGDKATTETIRIGEVKTCRATFTVPALAEGLWRLKVNVNSYHDVFEGSLFANNALTSDRTVEISLPSIDPAQGATDGVINAGVPKVLKLTFAEGEENRMVHLDIPAGVKVAYGFGFMSRGANASGTITAGDNGALFRVPEGVTDVYVTLESDTTAQYALSFENTKVEITSVSPNTLPSSGQVTVTITGAGFVSSNTIELVGGGKSVVPGSVQYVDAGTLVTTIDCTKLVAGTSYDLQVGDGETVSLAANAVSVAAVQGKGEFWARLVVSDSVRQGRKVTYCIEYGNSGTANVASPLLTISSSGDMLFSHHDSDAYRAKISLIAYGADSAVSISPGESCKYYFNGMLNNGMKGSVILEKTDEEKLVSDHVFSNIASDDTLDDIRMYFGRTWGDLLTRVRTSVAMFPALRFTCDEIDDLVNMSYMYYKTGCSELHGRAFDTSTGERLANTRIFLIRIQSGAIQRVSSVVTDKNGLYNFNFITNGSYCIEVEGRDVQNKVLEIESSRSYIYDVMTTAGHDVFIDFSCIPDDILKTAVCRLRNQKTCQEITVDLGDKHLVKVDNLCSGLWYCYLMRENDIIGNGLEVHIDSQSKTVVFPEFEIETFRVRIVDEFGMSIPNSTVMSLPDKILKKEYPEWIGSVVKGTEIALYAMADGYVSSYTNQIINEDSNIDIVLRRGNNVTGVLRQSDGAFVPRAIIIFQSTAGDASPLWTVADEEGRYSLHLLDGDYKVVALGTEFSCQVNGAGEYDFSDTSSNIPQLQARNPLRIQSNNDGILELKIKEKLLRGIAFIFSGFPKQFLLNYLGDTGKDIVKPKHSDPSNPWPILKDGDDSCFDGDFVQTYDQGTKNDIAKFLKPLVGILHKGDEIGACFTKRLDFNTGDGYSQYHGYSKFFTMRMQELTIGFGGLSEPSLLIRDIDGPAMSSDGKMRYLIKYTLKNLDYYDFHHELCHIELGTLEENGWATPFWTELDIADNIEVIVDASCDMPGTKIDSKEMPILFSIDPNEMVGPMGKGDPETERFVKPGEWMTYTVYFENKSDATAAAQEVYVTNPLNEYLDWTTFEMGEVAFNNQIDLGLVGKRSGASEVTMNGTNYVVRTELNLDEQTGVIDWYLRIVDPTTETGWPEDVFAGFLPPNDETFRGEGHITYRVKVREDAPPFAVINNSATIVFDYNDPIETDPAWWNTVSSTAVETSGQYVTLDLADELGLEIPDDVDYAAGDKVTIKVEGLAKGLKVVATPVYEDPNAKKKVIVDYVYTIEGVPTEPVDFEKQPMYARVTVTYKDKTKTADKTGKAETLQPVKLSIESAEVRTLAAGALNAVYEPVDIGALWPEVADAKTNPKEWSFKGWPAGLKYNATAKDASWSYKDDKATVKATAEPYTVYGQPTKAGEYPITATWKHKLADGKTTVSETFSAVLTVWGDDGASDFRAVSQAYVALTKNFGTGVTAMSGLPTGLKFTAKAVAATAKAPAQEAGDVYGTPTKPGVFAVTATLADKTKETFLWKVTEGENPGLDAAAIGWADAKVKFDGETKKATILQGLEADFAVEASALAAGAKVTVSGLPSGLKYDAKTGRITGIATKAESKVVTVKVVQNGVTEVRTFAIVVDANPFAGTYYTYLIKPKSGVESYAATAVVTPAVGGSAKVVLDEYVPSLGKTVKTTVTVKGFTMLSEYDPAESDEIEIMYAFKLAANAKGNPDYATEEREFLVALWRWTDEGVGFSEGECALRSSGFGVNGGVIKALTAAEYVTYAEKFAKAAPEVVTAVVQDDAGHFLYGSAVFDEKKVQYQLTGKLRDGTAVKALLPLGTLDGGFVSAPCLLVEKGGIKRAAVGALLETEDSGEGTAMKMWLWGTAAGQMKEPCSRFDKSGIPATAAAALGGESELVLDAAELAASGFEGEAPAFRFVVNGTSWAKAKLDIYAPGVEEGAKPLASLASAKLQASAGYVFKGSFKWEAKVGGDGNTYSFELVPSTTDGKTFVGRCEVKPAKGAAIVVTARLKPEIE